MTAKNSHLPFPIQLLAIALAYFVSGKLGLLLAIPPGYATAVWPPSGFALAGVLLFGYRVWPGVLLGSFLVNITVSFDASTTQAILKSLTLAASIGLGAALQALAGASLIRRIVGFPNPLVREKDILVFLVLGGPLSCLVNATWGVTTLFTGGAIPLSSFAYSWFTWWVGDTIGALIFAPLILVWTAGPDRSIWQKRRVTLTLPLAVTFALAVVIFVYVSAREQARIHLDFERRVTALIHDLRIGFDGYQDVLHAIERHFATTSSVTHSDFRAFVQGAFERHPGIQAL